MSQCGLSVSRVHFECRQEHQVGLCLSFAKWVDFPEITKRNLGGSSTKLRHRPSIKASLLKRMSRPVGYDRRTVGGIDESVPRV